ncbi:hypothetical protein [Mycoplasmopsis gallinarum]|uniref:Methylase-associated X1 domain-containing protein n=1 Tax=Mycoplasmopsis gallinarum TaxID=29557 RepID=A0A168RPF2_9BACT|nr:hypothetical protein [Mycoplasmopsis gallinarum]OAB49166.1 hypothetical protein MGALLINA_00340 [Mycoplasmopsis gallinarum]
MFKKQVSKSEQINKYYEINYDYDQPLNKKTISLVLKNILGENLSIEKYQGNKIVYSYKNGNIKEYFLVGSVTYLSHPHPKYKKRYQLKKWYRDFFEDHNNNENEKIRLIGVYHYEGLIIFIDFDINDYIYNKLNSSSAHVYTNDLYQATLNSVFEKIDKRNNKIKVIKASNFKKYLSGTISKNPVFSFFDKFNNNFEFNNWILAKDAIMQMKNENWYQWKGTEWAGWFLEFKFYKFLRSENFENQISYIANQKIDSFLDFDLFFKTNRHYGDLKASDIKNNLMPGNDQQNILNAINKYNKLWYIIYEHETIKDIDKENEMAILRMNLIGKLKGKDGKISYASRMKHSVNFKKMRILELNKINMNNILSEFKQGHQPNGSSRKPKFLINKDNIDNYVIYSYNIEINSK